MRAREPVHVEVAHDADQERQRIFEAAGRDPYLPERHQQLGGPGMRTAAEADIRGDRWRRAIAVR